MSRHFKETTGIISKSGKRNMNESELQQKLIEVGISSAAIYNKHLIPVCLHTIIRRSVHAHTFTTGGTHFPEAIGSIQM